MADLVLGRASSGAPPQDLWAITSYFNPVGYKRRLANYRVFRQALRVPLIAVELGYLDEYELGPSDADILLQLRGGDIMWQKERLLNLALDALPRGCSAVAWIDCDILFERDDWPQLTAVALGRHTLVQLFRRVHYMPASLSNGTRDPTHAEAWRTSLASAVASGLSSRECLDDANMRVYGLYSPGFAWAARRDFITRYGFYDGCIVGGGDRAMASAAYDYSKHVIRRHHMIDSEVERYLAWARPYLQGLDGSIGSIEGDIFHLWHGTLDNRRMRERHQGLSRFRFDPSQDLTVGETGAWKWNSDKPEMHEFVRRRFIERQEDGVTRD